MEKIKIRGLAVCAGWIFAVFGIIVALKGFWDVFFGEPEANYFSQSKWEFVSRQQWFTWSGFEITYGVSCIAIAYLLIRYAQRLPEYIERKIEGDTRF
jgi:hypothetical protein